MNQLTLCSSCEIYKNYRCKGEVTPIYCQFYYRIEKDSKGRIHIVE